MRQEAEKSVVLCAIVWTSIYAAAAFFAQSQRTINNQHRQFHFHVEIHADMSVNIMNFIY